MMQMAILWIKADANRIRMGRMTIDNVPEKWRAEVEKLLGVSEE